MPSKKPSRRIRRTREHVIADLSRNYVERQALLCGYSVQRREPDYGLDLLVNTYNPHGEIQNGHFQLQVKASQRRQIFQIDQAGVGHVLTTEVQMDQAFQILERQKTIIGQFFVPLLIRDFQPRIVLGDVHDQAALLLNSGERLFLDFGALRFIRGLGQDDTGGDRE